MGCPGRCGLGGNVDMQDPPIAVAKKNEYIQHAESNCRHGEEVTSDDLVAWLARNVR